MGQRKKYDKAFKERQYSAYWRKRPLSADTAKELGIHYSTVREWVKHYKQDGTNAFPGSGNLKPDDEEVRNMRKQLADLKEENEILKKAAAYFAKNLK